MSLLPIGIALAEALAQGILPALIFRSRSIGGFVADATLEEQHHDELHVTEHPVEQGAAITDHSYKRPATVIIRAGWSNSSLRSLGNPNYVIDMYQNFLSLQASRQPFDVLTGKRAYTNMLMTRLSTETTEKTENALVLTVECREVILVSTATVTVPSANVMKDPQSTAATQDQGTKQLSGPGSFNGAAAGLG